MTDIEQGSTSLLMRLVGDAEQSALFDERTSVEGWLAAERALALAQAEHGVLAPEEADAISGAARFERLDVDRLWQVARTVGYPIHGLVQQIAGGLPAAAGGRVHFGATTQDIMDTGLALQLVRSLDGLDHAATRLGDALAAQALQHAGTIMAARTHGQQAVPTTLGAVLAGLLNELARHRVRIAESGPRIGTVQLFGAGGTAAALGPRSRPIRASFARLLGLADPALPWHVARDTVAEFGWLCVTVTATCARLARNVVDLSRTEVGEVFERYESHRGASSTMPQKVNPISSEALIGLAGTAGALASALPRMQEAGHERAAGEWQIEWQVLPQLAALAGTALTTAAEVVEGVRVDPERMRANLRLDGGLVMAEAAMMHIARDLGHTVAHDLVYEAATRARADGTDLATALHEVAAQRGLDGAIPADAADPEAYLGEAVGAAGVAVDLWAALPAPSSSRPAIADLATGPADPTEGTDR